MFGLNQYTQRTVPGYLDILGSATNSATVNVNGLTASRKSDYYRAELHPDNSVNPVYLSVTNVAVWAFGTNDMVTNAVGNVFLPKTPETFGHDLDGNQTNDGRWTLTWDGENRLIKMQSLSGAPVGSSNRITFTYDHQGRRTRKVTETFVSGAWSITLSNRFVYDGWNLLAELNATNNAVINSFAWGLDLSGSLQGAGGVGGLLAITTTNAATHFVGYDGNGNVAILSSASTGVSSANYEYDPFGNVLRATGPMALLSPFRFSTKYTDRESGFNYYGYRSYNPAAGRWLSRDPISELGFQKTLETRNRHAWDGNLYCFVGNNPLRKFDLLGLTDKDVQTIISAFLSTLKTMCGDGRCCHERGWLQNFEWWLPSSNREGCTQQAIDLYAAMYPLTQGGLDDKWVADSHQDLILPFFPVSYYHNYVTMTPRTPQPEGPDGFIVDKITVDTFMGCYTITRRKMIFIEQNPQQSFWQWKNETKCFKCKDLKAGGGK